MKLTIPRCTLWQLRSSRKRLLRLKKRVKTVYNVFPREKKFPDLVERIPIYATALRQVDSHPGSSPKDKKRKRERKKQNRMSRIGVYARERRDRRKR